MTSPILTPAELAEIEKRCEAATPGPWLTYRPWSDMPEYERVAYQPYDDAIVVPLPSINAHGDYSLADTRFIAHARTDVPRLLASYRALEEKVERLEAVQAAAERVCLFHEWDMTYRGAPDFVPIGSQDEVQSSLVQALAASGAGGSE